MNIPLILLAEDDKPIRKLITTTLQTQGYLYHTMMP
ncbi:Two-component system, OmpR family, KDP operon response regulator KdpE [Paenibacillus typhae]|uniref:Two-component system, OmpR family, KDP operon response regulator KdpE n=1 Tax=Paenibacillus typhae TaxID=1174501 RepID=A0A1G8GHS4_9BACL|nr:two-component system, OmpR family, KDP operon response regulator KdpE [Paenibacillus typhae]